MAEAIVLFDGVCNLCNGAVQWLIKRDKKKVLRYASLQSEYGAEFLKEAKLPVETDSIILVCGNEVLTESAAIIKIAQLLGFPYNLAAAGKCLPPGWRNVIYRWIAKNRYKWFGKREECMLPTADTQKLFL